MFGSPAAATSVGNQSRPETMPFSTLPAGKVENGIVSGLDWFPTLVAAAGDPNIVDELKAGKEIDGQEFKVHLDGYDQTDLITGKGPSKRHEVFYFTES